MFSDLPAFHSVHRHRTSPEEGRMLYENTERDFPVMDRICPSRENHAKVPACVIKVTEQILTAYF